MNENAANATTMSSSSNHNKKPNNPNKKKVEPDRVLILGKPDWNRCDNEVVSARYTLWTFFPKAILEQFRRFANLYFLAIGLIMFVGYYTDAYDSSFSPWTTLGPLALVISISLLVEGSADYKRHRNDEETNNEPCVVLKRAEELDENSNNNNESHKKKPLFFFSRTRQPKYTRDEKIQGGRDVVVNLHKAYYASISTSTRYPSARQRTFTDPSDDPTPENVSVSFAKVKRKDIRQGEVVFIKNREMVPADIVLLASANDRGGAYIETSSIDGETNLKLRNSPHLPARVLQALRDGNPVTASTLASPSSKASTTTTDAVAATDGESFPTQQAGIKSEFETLDAAVKRITRMSALGRTEGKSAIEHPSVLRPTLASVTEEQSNILSDGQKQEDNSDAISLTMGEESTMTMKKHNLSNHNNHLSNNNDNKSTKYVAALTTEPPNASVHTFSGKLTLPPFKEGEPCQKIALTADNVLLRGAVLRNTEWAIGVAFFTGKDTKLVQNSFETPSKFSQLDRLMNKTVVFMLILMILIISTLATAAYIANNDKFDTLFYAGYNVDMTETWPYLPDTLEVPQWTNKTYNWVQWFFLYVTLLSNLIPLSLYVTVELVQYFLLWYIYADLEMYDDTTDNRALARSTIVSDLGRIQYIFTDKTGTLTQNVMRFRRCSVDGMAFGAPIERKRPQLEPGNSSNNNKEGEEGDERSSAFHPLRQLLIGQLGRPAGLEGLGGFSPVGSRQRLVSPSRHGNKLTFHAEMFLRVMSLCHTVVVEKDIENKEEISSGISMGSQQSNRSLGSLTKNLISFNRRRANTDGSMLGSVGENLEIDFAGGGPLRGRTLSANSVAPGINPEIAMNSDGAPYGYAYQAESPDEGALVSAASTKFGFQVIGRDMNGIRLRCCVSSHLQDTHVTEGLKSKRISLNQLAADTAVALPASNPEETALDNRDDLNFRGEQREETWSILALNKFDSERKRMSILLRSPPELGYLPILFCKGADSSMLDPEVCEDLSPFPDAHNSVKAASSLSAVSEDSDEQVDGEGVDEAAYTMASMLGIQVHLGEFAKEGLRTLVLGMKILTEKECTEWLSMYESAVTSMKNREQLLTEAAKKIEKGLHIVGATAIEDKLQRRVPETIAKLEKAGIKLWVLTGDKRETAVEIGYSTHVLTSKMHLTEVPDNGKKYVRTQMAMEFIRLVKHGKLPQYQKAALDESTHWSLGRRFSDFRYFCKSWRHKFRRVSMRLTANIFRLLRQKDHAERKIAEIVEMEKIDHQMTKARKRRHNVREKADMTIKQWIQENPKGLANIPSNDSDDNLSTELASEELPAVFNRASSARSLLHDLQNSGSLSKLELRRLSIAYLTAQQAGVKERGDSAPIIDEDTLSLESFVPSGRGMQSDFDRKKRTILERLFAVDREVRKGRLKKHMSDERIRELSEGQGHVEQDRERYQIEGPRALVIEGSALKHLLGDPEFEEILFSVASNCDAVIACRVSPKQKAQLVGLVRKNIRPEPITLAIGDGANDVGMIQEAHVGVGISGKEGRQAVNASDYSIAQFRFLETLILIHGRWDFFRLSTVTMFSFYKNAVMAGTIMVYTSRTVYSGTSLYDQWVVSLLNFVAALPIIFTGIFDRCLSKDYVRNHPEVYKATRENELITLRVLARWISLCICHVFILYFFTVPQQSYGGGITSAFYGMMSRRDPDYPGDGESGGLQVVGTVTYTCMIFLLAYKVLYESRSLVHGHWPAFTCRKGVGEGVPSRIAYTWVGVTYGSILFYLFAIGIYQIFGRSGPGSFGLFTDVTNHALGTKSLNWMLITFVPMMGMVLDVVFKVFSNMYYPTQTQIHLEAEALGKKEKKRLARETRRNNFRVNGNEENVPTLEEP